MTNNITKTAVKTMDIVDNEENLLSQMQIKFYDAIRTCGKLNQYGLYSNAPIGSLVVAMQINGQEEVLFGIEDDVNNRPRSLKNGEVMLFNSITKSYLYLKEDGNIEVFAKQNLQLDVQGNITINCPNANINGNVNIKGTLYADVIQSGNGVDGTFTQSVTSTKGIVTAGT